MSKPEYTFIPSVLHVVGHEIDLTQDFSSTSDKTIDDLVNEEKTSQNQKKEETKQTTK